jgi:hypothetical protein
MSTALLLITFLQGIGAGICVDVALVKLPTRHRIGTVAYAEFARGNDLHYALRLNPFVVVGGGMLLVTLTIIAFITRHPTATLHPLLLASGCAAGYLGATLKAPPIMWSLRKSPDEEAVLAHKLDRFAFWHAWRTLFQLGAFAILLWALA